MGNITSTEQKKQVLSGICTDFLLVKPSFFVE